MGNVAKSYNIIIDLIVDENVNRFNVYQKKSRLDFQKGCPNYSTHCFNKKRETFYILKLNVKIFDKQNILTVEACNI